MQSFSFLQALFGSWTAECLFSFLLGLLWCPELSKRSYNLAETQIKLQRMHVFSCIACDFTKHVRPCFSLFLWFGSVHAIRSFNSMWINHWINHWIMLRTLSFLSHAIQRSYFLNCMNELHEPLNAHEWPALQVPTLCISCRNCKKNHAYTILNVYFIEAMQKFITDLLLKLPANVRWEDQSRFTTNRSSKIHPIITGDILTAL
jgi:hypothetical protein